MRTRRSRLRFESLVLALGLTAWPLWALGQTTDAPIVVTPLPNSQGPSLAEDKAKATTSEPIVPLMSLGIGPDLTTSPSEGLAAAIGFTDKTTSLSLVARPGKVASTHQLWGFSISGLYRTDNRSLVFGGGYQFKLRWLAPGTFSSLVKNKCNNPKNDLRDGRRCLATLWPRLIPSVYVGGEVGFFGFDRERTEQNWISRTALVTKIEERIGALWEINLGFTFSEERYSTDLAILPATQYLLAGTAVWVVPEILGFEPYDDDQAKTLFQRGLGLGVSGTYKVCDVPSSEVNPRCSSKALFASSEASIGGIIDLRYKPFLIPRLVVSYARLDGISGDPALKKDGMTFEIQAASALMP